MYRPSLCDPIRMNSEQVFGITPTRNGNVWEVQPPVICGVC